MTESIPSQEHKDLSLELIESKTDSDSCTCWPSVQSKPANAELTCVELLCIRQVCGTCAGIPGTRGEGGPGGAGGGAGGSGVGVGRVTVGGGVVVLPVTKV